MKQVLSIADFATILKMVDAGIANYEYVAMGWGATEQEKQKAKKERKEYLKTNPEYNNLKHLKKSLQNLNIEIECPDVEIKGE